MSPYRPPFSPNWVYYIKSVEVPQRPQLVVALLEEFVEIELLQLRECLKDRRLHGRTSRLVILLRAARGLLDDLVDRTELLEVRRGDLERGRRFGSLRTVAPENTRAALGSSQ